MIDFEKKYHYSLEDVDAAHELVFLRLESLRKIVEEFNETVEQAAFILMGAGIRTHSWCAMD